MKIETLVAELKINLNFRGVIRTFPFFFKGNLSYSFIKKKKKSREPLHPYIKEYKALINHS